MEGPSQAKIECDDKGDGSCDVRYWPTEAGEYAVHVLCSSEDIQHSPFMAEIVNPPGKDFHPDKVCTNGQIPSARHTTQNEYQLFLFIEVLFVKESCLCSVSHVTVFLISSMDVFLPG